MIAHKFIRIPEVLKNIRYFRPLAHCVWQLTMRVVVVSATWNYPLPPHTVMRSLLLQPQKSTYNYIAKCLKNM